jgi:hypothetical protein
MQRTTENVKRDVTFNCLIAGLFLKMLWLKIVHCRSQLSFRIILKFDILELAQQVFSDNFSLSLNF